MKHKFITPVSMKVTQEQYDRDLKKPLEELGYIETSLSSFKEGINYMSTNLAYVSENISNLDLKRATDKARYLIDHYNPQLFLALAAMTKGKLPIVGEWMYPYGLTGEDNHKLFEVKKLGEWNDHTIGLIDGDNPTGCGSWRKATKEGLINHFMGIVNKRFPLQLSWQNAQRIIDIACNSWTDKLANTWGSFIVKKETIYVQQGAYEKMREACTPDQHKLFDEIFGKDVEEVTYKMGDRFKSNGNVYILAGVDQNNALCMINLSTGLRFNNPFSVLDWRKVTQLEFNKIANESFTKI